MTTRAEKKAATREGILDAAMALLSAGRGLGSLGLRELAREADLAPTSLYNHFHDMHALGLALIDRACFRLRSFMGAGRRDLMAGNARTAMEVLAARFLDYLEEHESEFRLLVQQRLGDTPAYRRRIHREMQLLVEELAEDIRGVVAARGGPAVESLREAEAAVAVMFGFGLVALDLSPQGRRRNVGRVVDQLTMVFLGGRAVARGERL